MMRGRSFSVFLLVFALVLRLVLLSATFPGNENVKYYEDVSIASNLLDGKGFAMAYSALDDTNDSFGPPIGWTLPPPEVRPSGLKTPVYPSLVAGVFWLFGVKNFLPLLILHAILSAFTAVFVYLAMRESAPRFAKVSGLCVALYPPFVFHAISVPESTTLLLFLMSLFLYRLERYRHAPSTPGWIFAAAVGGTIMLIEAVAIPFIGFALLYVALLTPGGTLRAARNVGLAMVVLLVLVLPWLIRNQRVSGKFPILRTGVGVNLLMTLRGAEELPDESLLELEEITRGSDEFLENELVGSYLKSWILKHPDSYARAVARNFKNLWWEPDRYRDDPSLKYLIGRKVPYVVLLCLSLPLAFWVLVKLLIAPRNGVREVLHLLVLAVIFSYTFVYTLFGANNLRYHFPVQLMLLLLAGESIVRLAQRLPWSGGASGRRDPAPAP